MPKRVLRGTVVTAGGDKTIIVRVERRVMHPLYKKFIRRSKKYAAHDEDNRYAPGDKVRIDGHFYSPQPPMLALVGALPYAALHHPLQTVIGQAPAGFGVEGEQGFVGHARTYLRVT